MLQRSVPGAAQAVSTFQGRIRLPDKVWPRSHRASARASLTFRDTSTTSPRPRSLLPSPRRHLSLPRTPRLLCCTPLPPLRDLPAVLPSSDKTRQHPPARVLSSAIRGSCRITCHSELSSPIKAPCVSCVTSTCVGQLGPSVGSPRLLFPHTRLCWTSASHITSPDHSLSSSPPPPLPLPSPSSSSSSGPPHDLCVSRAAVTCSTRWSRALLGGHALGEVARHVHVAAAHDRDVVRQQLYRPSPPQYQAPHRRYT